MITRPTSALVIGIFFVLIGIIGVTHAESTAPLVGAYRAYLPLTQDHQNINIAPLRDYVAVAVGSGATSAYWDLYRVRADGSEITLLNDSPLHDFNASLSADHSTILFSYSDSIREDTHNDLRLLNLDGTNLRSLTTELVTNEGYWSPNSQYVAIKNTKLIDNFYYNTLYVASLAGESSLVEVGARATFGGWSPDGKGFLYSKSDGGNSWYLYLYNVAQQQSTPVAMKVWGAVWSPDSATLYYYTATDEDGNAVLTAYDIASGVQRPLTSPVVPGVIVAVINDGAELLVRHDDYYPYDLYAVATDGSGARPIYDGSKGSIAVTVAPDGKSFVGTYCVSNCYSPSGDSHYRAFYQKFDGTAPILIETPNDTHNFGSFQWSPDGRQIAFHSWYQLGDVGEYKDLYVYDVTHPLLPARLLAQDRGDPQWIGNSGYLSAYVSLGVPDLYFYDAASGAGYKSPMQDFNIQTEWVYLPH